MQIGEVQRLAVDVELVETKIVAADRVRRRNLPLEILVIQNRIAAGQTETKIDHGVPFIRFEDLEEIFRPDRLHSHDVGIEIGDQRLELFELES